MNRKPTGRPKLGPPIRMRPATFSLLESYAIKQGVQTSTALDDIVARFFRDQRELEKLK